MDLILIKTVQDKKMIENYMLLEILEPQAVDQKLLEKEGGVEMYC